MTLNTIWKFPLALQERQTILMPRESNLLHIGAPSLPESILLWAAVDDKAPQDEVEFIIAGTGHPLPHVGSHVGTVQTSDGFVWHVFTGPNCSLTRSTELHFHTKDNGG